MINKLKKEGNKLKKIQVKIDYGLSVIAIVL